jgi:hypothetical protein
MKVEFLTPIISITGEQMKEQTQDDNGQVVSSKNLIAKDLFLRALTVKEETSANKALDFAMSVKVIQCKEETIDLESAEQERLKTKIAKVYDAWIMGQLHLLLEGKKLEL